MAGLVDFQDEEEVKSFLENLEVECNYHCYHEKDPDGERLQRSPATRRGEACRERSGLRPLRGWRRNHVAGGGRGSVDRGDCVCWEGRCVPGRPSLEAGAGRKRRAGAFGLGTGDL